MNEIVIPYKVRRHFVALHEDKHRWKVVVAHRRAGKTVALINELIRAVISNPRPFPPPRGAYIAPSFSQAKDLCWNYLKTYTAPIPGVKFLETELSVVFPNGGRISLFGGAQAYERIRGLYLDYAVLDEVALLHPDCFDVVVRPALSDYNGCAVLCGTPQGRDHFYQYYDRARKNPDVWATFSIPVTETNALHPDEVSEMKRMMTPNQFARELLCSFEAPVEFSYYGDLITELQMRNQICEVPYDARAGVITSFDLGMHDQTSVWFAQRIGREIHIIDFLQGSGKGLDYYVKQIQLRGYTYAGHVFPHDVKVRELGTGLSRYEVLEQLGLEVTLCPDHRIDDGISAVRAFLPMCWFDEKRTEEGLIALKMYQSAPAPALGTANNRPLHNFASHAADSFRYLALGLDQVIGWSTSTSTWGDKFKQWRIPGLA